MAFPGTPVGHLFGPRQRMANTIPQFMSPNAPAFANPPGFAHVNAIPELEASYALVTDRIHYQSGQEEITAERVALEANLQQEYRDRELLLRNELVELHFAHYMSRQARAELQTWEEQQRELYETRFRALGHEMHQHFAQQELNQEALSLRYFRAELILLAFMQKRDFYFLPFLGQNEVQLNSPFFGHFSSRAFP